MAHPGERTVSRDGYEVTLHPAFASRCEVMRRDGEEHELYRQKGVHNHGVGERHPKRHLVRLKGGPDDRDLTLMVDDPKAQIARVTIELYDPSHEPGWGRGDEFGRDVNRAERRLRVSAVCATDDGTMTGDDAVRG
jgi:hypothetical protein